MSEILKFSWSDRAQFISELRTAGGSGNVVGVIDGERPSPHLGRYARQYSLDATDAPGRTATFHCEVIKSDRWHVLTGVPWSNKDDYDTAYSVLIESGSTPNDLIESERAQALVYRQWPASPTMAQVAAIERQEVADGAAYRPDNDDTSAATSSDSDT